MTMHDSNVNYQYEVGQLLYIKALELHYKSQPEKDRRARTDGDASSIEDRDALWADLAAVLD